MKTYTVPKLVIMLIVVHAFFLRCNKVSHNGNFNQPEMNPASQMTL